LVQALKAISQALISGCIAWHRPESTMAKYPWGDSPKNMPATFAIDLVCALLLGVLLALTGPDGGSESPTQTQLRPVAVVTCAFVVMWYMFLGNQVGVRFTEGLPDDVKASATTAANTTVSNALEQAIPFLALMWLEALFVNARTAQILGWVYVVGRFLYPVIYGMYGEFSAFVMLSTMPNYCIITYFTLTVFFKASCGIDLHAKIDAVSPWLMPLFLVACSLGCFIAFLGLAAPTTSIIIAGAKKNVGFVDPEDVDEE